MGRKIPGKKHRGVKDPLRQLARRDILNNVDAPPRDPGEQEVPRRVLEIRTFQGLLRDNTSSGRNKRKTNFINTGKMERDLNCQQRLKKKKCAKPQREKNDYLTKFSDNVKFGEVAHRPPVFARQPKGTSLSDKPGMKNLILKGILNDGVTKKSSTETMSMAMKRRVQEERDVVINAYRELKKKKQMFK